MYNVQYNVIWGVDKVGYFAKDIVSMGRVCHKRAALSRSTQ